MSLLDFSKNCDITTHSFKDDLLSYSVKNNEIIWENKSTEVYTVKQDIFSSSDNQDTWTPVFCQDDNLVSNKIISHYGSVTGDSSFSSGRIGIENFIEFSPKFKNWTISDGNMVIDWILNRSRSEHRIEAGLMYWKRTIPQISGKIDTFPNYAKLKYNNISYIKLDNQTIRRIFPDPSIQSSFSSNSTIYFNYTNNDADILVSNIDPNNVNPDFILDRSDHTEIWIPDGDQLLYFSNQSEKIQDYFNNISCRSYISGSLYKYYNIFYNSLTANNNLIKLTDTRSKNILRKYKKLAHSLSTSPFSSEFFASLLAKPTDNIKNAINSYLETNINSIEVEISTLYNVLSIIGQEYSLYEINSNNIVKNNDELFIKLINKYGAKLLMGGTSTLSYNPMLAHGNSIIIEEIGETLVPKTFNDIIVTNNKTINIGNLSVETNVGDNESNIALKHNNTTNKTIFLYDSVKPYVNDGSKIGIALEKNNSVEELLRNKPSRIPGVDINPRADYSLNDNVFYWGTNNNQNASMAQWLRYSPKLKMLHTNLLEKYSDPRVPNLANDLINGEFNFVWTKVSGPNCKFVDLNKTQTNKSYNVAYSNEVMLVPSSTGKYVIKCVASGPYGSYTKIKTIFVVDGNEKTEGGGVNANFGTFSISGNDNFINTPNAPNTDRININTINLDLFSVENAPININKDKLRVFISGLNSIAIHRNGLFAPIRTNYYAQKGYSWQGPIEKLNESNNYLFMFVDYYSNLASNQNITPQTTNTKLNIIYRNDNTLIKLDRIILRNIRNDTAECSQCYSLYKPKFSSVIGGVTIKRPQFSRINKNPSEFRLQKYAPRRVLANHTLHFPDNSVNNDLSNEYRYPIISSDNAPQIKTYGGYGNKILNKLSINNISSLSKPTDTSNNIIAINPVMLPPTTGYLLDSKDDNNNDKFCYQDIIMPNTENNILFKKGCFVPDSGWVVNDNSNLSSVLKFNPGARESFSFSGPGILGISNYSSSGLITANIFKSSIELNINSLIQWDNGGEFCPVQESSDSDVIKNKNRRATIKANHLIKNQLTKELTDQYAGGPNDYHHGYRILNGGLFKRPETNLLSNSTPVNDEFNLSIDEDSNKFIYSFNVVGPNYPINIDQETQSILNLQAKGIDPGAANGAGQPVLDFIEQNKNINLRNPRINNLTIKDVEIKLNFLNYVNTKNLIIWLEVEYCDTEKEGMRLIQSSNSAPRAPPQITSSNNFIDQFIPNNTHKKYGIDNNINNDFNTSNFIDVKNIGINDYLKKLTDQNSTNYPEDNVVLYLLNQETIQNKDYNFSIKFSNSTNKNNVLYDINSFSRGPLNPDQNVVNNNSSVNPSCHVAELNTYANSVGSNILKLNRLNINNNTFEKLCNRSLFKRNPRPSKGCSYLFPNYDSSTKFTLNIAVLEEPDEMFPMDTIVNNELLTSISNIETSIVSANLFNNLCSWELILHTEDVKKPVTSQVNSLANYGGTDSLSLIEYGKKPQYPGYSFIADLTETKFLLPLVNMNAPTTFFQNYNACEYADNELIGKGVLINTPRFPSEAIIFILAGTAVGGMTGTLVGVLVGGLGATYYLGFEMLMGYFRESRAIPILELAQRETFDIEYDSYPFGNSDKILLNISKDGIFWYKVEASIFKLNNTPALPLKEYKLIKADSKLFRFDFFVVSKNSDIVDELFVPYVVQQATPANADDETKAIFQNIDNEVYNTFNFMSVNELVFFNRVVHNTNIFQHLHQENETLIAIDSSIPYYLISINDSITLDCNNLLAKVICKALIYKDSKYITILVLDKSKEILNQCSSFLLPENIVIICGAENSTFENGTYSPISLFGLNSDQPPNDTVPDLTFSTNSLGSYGNGSNIKNKNILSRKVQINNIESIYNQLNSFKNDKFYYNELSLILPNQNGIGFMAPTDIPVGEKITINSALESYPVYYDTINNYIVNNSFYHIYDNTFNNNTTDNTETIRNLLNNINTSIKDNKTYSKDYKYNMIYLKIKNSDIINRLYRNTIASVTIENNYSYKETIERITQDQLNILTTRLDTINNTNIVSLDNLIGKSSETNRILLSDSIYYIQQHYNNLDDDEADCFQTLNNPSCYKYRTYSKLQKLYTERNDLLKLIDFQTIKKAKIFISSEDFNNNNFLQGFIEFDNTEFIKLTTSEVLEKANLFKIIYSYILDIEKQKYHTTDGGIIPSQRVNITQNSDKSIDIEYQNLSDNYYWINIDPKQSISIAEEMRPRILKSIKYICQNTNPVFSAVGVGGQIFDFNNICPDFSFVNNLQNDNIIVTADSTGTTYTFKDSIIDQKKNKYQDKVTIWKTQTIERRFRIHSEKNFRNTLPNAEFLVTSVETYEIGLDPLETQYEQGVSREELITNKFLKTDFSGDMFQGLNNGLGSLSNKPTRVYNIFNLDDTSELKVQFRKAPRSMRAIDSVGTILRYGQNNSYRPQNRPPLDPLDTWGVRRTESLINNFYEWKCLEKGKTDSSLKESSLPDFFKLLNEMMFRTFFGSVDEIENKTHQLRSLYDFEMIPYEYFTKPQPTPTPTQ